MMTYDATTVDLEIERLRTERRRHAGRVSSSHEVLPAIKMLIGDWQIDKLGILTREIKARD
jgi:hypothetical protein